MDEMILIYLFVLAVGACIGSFLNVVALRAISKESIVFPASKCPICNEPIKWYDNIPVLSYLFTFRGKCRNCGCHVSLQYPIIEAITALLFLLTYYTFGFSLRSLFILILLSIAIVITITDFKKEYIYNSHMWTFIIFSVLYSVLFVKGVANIFQVCVGLIVGVIAMELLARLSYLLIRKHCDEPKEEATQDEQNENAQEVQEENKQEVVAEEKAQDEKVEDKQADEDENVDINEYIEKNKRAFGEGDTYLAAGVGALLGGYYVLVAIALAIILQAVCILPQFFINLYKEKEYRLLTSLSLFTAIAIVYWILNNIFTLNIIFVLVFVIALIFFAIDSITRLKRTVNKQGFVSIPFGPALLFSTFTLFFFGAPIVNFINKHVFMIFG